MAWPVYSERFLHHKAAGTWRWTCPEGRRALVQDILAVNFAPAGSWGYVLVGPIAAAQFQFPAQIFNISLQPRVVVYQGEVIELYISTTDLSVTISGSLFTDDSGATGPPGDSEYDPHHPGQMPSEPLPGDLSV